MTDYERVTTRETTAVDPVADPMTRQPGRRLDGPDHRPRLRRRRARAARPRPPAS